MKNMKYFYEWTTAGMKKYKKQKQHFHLKAMWFDEF